MDFKGLFKGLASYIDFVISLLNYGGMEKYVRLGKISPELVSYFVIGVFIAYLISIMKSMPGYEKFQRQSESLIVPPPMKDLINLINMDMAQLTFYSIIIGVITHLCFLIYGAIVDMPAIGSARDTLNAVIGYNAFFHPINACNHQLMNLVEKLKGQVLFFL